MKKNLAASIRQRLLNHARKKNENFNFVLQRFAIQRFLYRLGISPYRDRFLLKGSWLFLVWNQQFHRPTKDVDLLGTGADDIDRLIRLFKEVIQLQVKDGLNFDAASVRGHLINETNRYQGVRVKFAAELDGARIHLQVDVGYGDTVVPEPQLEVLPVLLSFPAPRLRVYPVYSVIAEKFQAMVNLDIDNTRLKDFYDLWIIASTMTLESR